MCKRKWYKFSPTLLVEEWDDQHKYGGYFHSSKYVMEEGR
jgi:hypothetical protein